MIYLIVFGSSKTKHTRLLGGNIAGKPAKNNENLRRLQSFDMRQNPHRRPCFPVFKRDKNKIYRCFIAIEIKTLIFLVRFGIIRTPHQFVFIIQLQYRFSGRFFVCTYRKPVTISFA